MTFAGFATIVRRMENQTPKNIDALEQQLEQLLAKTRQLSEDNAMLKQQLQEIKADRAELLSQKEQVRHQVEGMISRLKTMETTSH